MADAKPSRMGNDSKPVPAANQQNRRGQSKPKTEGVKTPNGITRIDN